MRRDRPASAPVAQQHEKVARVDDAVAVEISRARLGRLGAVAPCREQGEQVGGVHDPVAVDIAGARDGHGQGEGERRFRFAWNVLIARDDEDLRLMARICSSLLLMRFFFTQIS